MSDLHFLYILGTFNNICTMTEKNAVEKTLHFHVAVSETLRVTAFSDSLCL